MGQTAGENVTQPVSLAVAPAVIAASKQQETHPRVFSAFVRKAVLTFQETPSDLLCYCTECDPDSFIYLQSNASTSTTPLTIYMKALPKLTWV